MSKRRTAGSIAAIFLLFVSCHRNSTNDANGGLQATVLVDSHKSSSGANVALINSKTFDVHKSKVAQNRRTFFKDITPGEYVLIVSPPDDLSCDGAALERATILPYSVTIVKTSLRCR